MKMVSASEANQKFSTLLSEAAGGEEIVITRRGKPAVRMVKATDDALHAGRVRALNAAIEHYRTLEPQLVRGWTRESLYDRDDRTPDR